MFSTRTRNTECVNSENVCFVSGSVKHDLLTYPQPLGFHLADGTLYTYVTGDEYEDITASWDWNLIPGTTVDYQATPLNCDNANWIGIESFVGGVSTGTVGIAAMKYTNPFTRNLAWQKTLFFLDDDTQFFMVSNISSKTPAPVYTVLDQRRHNGPVYLNGKLVDASNGTLNVSSATTLWHGNVGYKFDSSPTALGIQAANKTGDWSVIGISSQPPTTVDIFTAYIMHTTLSDPVSYLAFPAIDKDEFEAKAQWRNVRSVQNDGTISAVYDADHGKIYVVFWDPAGGTLSFIPEVWQGIVVFTSSANAALIVDLWNSKVIVSDPSQSLDSVAIDVKLGTWAVNKHLVIQLPSGGDAGSSVTRPIYG